MLRRVAIYSSKINPRTTEVITRLVNEFCPRGINIQLHEKAGDFQGCPRGSTIERFTDLKALSALPDLVLSVGGDGTFLEAMTMVKDFDVPVAGINTGRLGFLANISEEEIKPALEMIYNGNYGLVERSLLQITDPADLFNGSSSFALNEVTIQKADLNMITISVYIDGCQHLLG
ncbi:MAG: NAD(+)/NADH kinase [Bacteroidales bacterium]